MSFPEYIPRRTVVHAPSYAIESGEDLIVHVQVRASRSLIWHATGESFQVVEACSSATWGSPVELGLPLTDLSNSWRDSSTNEIILLEEPTDASHTYTATVTVYRSEGGKRVSSSEIGPFIVPFDSEPLRLDELIPTEPTSGSSIQIPPSWGPMLVEAQESANQSAQSASAAAGFSIQAGASAQSAATSATLAQAAASHELRGTGFPEGVVEAPVGTYYTDEAATSGAIRWVKEAGTGTTGWRVLHGDTGWRDVTADVDTNIFASGLTTWYEVRRIGSVIYHKVSALRLIDSISIAPLPVYDGFRGKSGTYLGPPNFPSGATFLSALNTNSALSYVDAPVDQAFYDYKSVPSVEPWPATLPGTSADL